MPAEKSSGTDRGAGEACLCGLPNIGMERDMHQRLAADLPSFPIGRGKHPGPLHSTPQHGVRSWQRSGLAVQRQTGHLGCDLGQTVEPIVHACTAQVWLQCTLSVHIRWHHRNRQALGAESWMDRPWAGIRDCSFPSGSAPAPPTLHHLWGRQILGEVYHRGSPGLRWQHSHLHSCSHSPPNPAYSTTA